MEHRADIDYAQLAYRLQVLFEDKVIAGYRDSFRGELGRTQAEVLERLYEHGPTRTQDLADALHVPKQHVSKIVAAFQKAGLVASAPDPSDGRAKTICITDAGRSLIDRHIHESGQRYLALIDGLSADEREELAASMERLIALFERI